MWGFFFLVRMAVYGDSNKDKDIHAEALERFRESERDSSDNRANLEADIRFARLGEQWPDKIRREREEEGRPCLTVNKLNAFIRQVTNDVRQNKPAINAHPVDNGADVATAEVINGIFRSIERKSQADVAYDTAVENAAAGGVGFIEVGIDYAHDDSFEMEARIHCIEDPLRVHWDTSTRRYDSADWMYAFVSDWMDKEDFEREYPDAEPVDFEANHDNKGDWFQDDKIRVARYWCRKPVKRKLLEIEMLDPMTGQFARQAIREDKLTDLHRMFLEQGLWRVLREREVDTFTVHRYVLNGVGVCGEPEDWQGTVIPVVPVWGDVVTIGGERHARSMIRDAKDPQQMFNFWQSASTELVALAPKSPWLLEEGAIPEGMEHIWATANTRSHAYLPYKRGMNMPQRQPFAGVPAGALQESLNASDNIKATLGMFDASIGAQGNETSGRAILARQREGDVSNFHIPDNLNRALVGIGKILLEIIPSVYSQRETIRILGDDMTEKVIRLAGEGRQPGIGEDGEPETLYDLSVGQYDVTVKSGPSYSTQREETREMLVEIIRALPDAALILGPTLMEHMDFQGADKVAEQLRQLQAVKGLAAPQPGMMNVGGMPGQPPVDPMAPAPQPGAIPQ